MGLTINAAQFLVQARQRGASFRRVLTLGRQHVMVGPERLESILREGGLWAPAQGVEAFRRELAQTPWRFDAFARALGAESVHACDASDYEGADLIHDLNQPVPDAWERQYDLVIDGGTIEHVFNFPVAIANCMRVVTVGGHLILLTPANNYFGHGFYQFSPELFFRVLSAENGFEVLRMVALGDAEGYSRCCGLGYAFPIVTPWHEVADPAKIRSRVTLINDRAVLLYVLARKLEHRPLFAKVPQQSDYAAQWRAHDPAGAPAGPVAVGGLAARLRCLFSETFCREQLPRLAWFVDPLRGWRFRRQHSFKNRRFYQRVPASTS